MSTEYDYLNTAFLNDVFNEDKLKDEIAAAVAITTALDYIRSSEDVQAGTTTVYFGFASDLSAGEQSTLDAVVAQHDGQPPVEWEVVHIPAPLKSVQAGASEVIANDRPAIEVQPGVTAFGASSFPWKKRNGYTTIRIAGHFILKASGTGASVRIGAKVKSQGVGEDSSQAFTPEGFVVVPVTFTTIGEVFAGYVDLDASGIEFEDSVALHIGRDGNNEMGAGSSDDVSVAVQIIDVRVEVS